MARRGNMEVINQKLYVGCSLTGAPEQFVQDVESLKHTLRSDHGYEIFDFVGLENGTDEDVYEWDIEHCVASCDAFIAILDYPSTGLGWELANAAQRRIPMLGVAHENTTVTRLVTGAAKRLPNFNFQRYQNLRLDVPRLMVDNLVQYHQL
jgi:nucleoside 2-deoxyribosyltransferase